MFVLVFGGAFNPVHIGHLKIADVIQKRLEYDEVWFAPCQMSRYGKRLVHYVTRMDMLSAAFEDFGNPTFKICSAEFEINAEGRMYVLANHLSKTYPDTEMNFLIGADSLTYIESWYKASTLLREFVFVVASRAGYKTRMDVLPNHIHVDIDEEHDVSSTVIRNHIRENGESSLVTPKVNKIIKGRNLYV